MASHTHEFVEIGRAFPLSEADFDVEYLSPDGGHVETGDSERPWELVPASHPDLVEKVPAPTPHVILQCVDPDCPDGPKHVEHVGLTDREWAKIRAAYEGGLLDPDANGTNRYLSQLSLDDLGLARISAKLSDEGRARSGARESVIFP